MWGVIGASAWRIIFDKLNGALSHFHLKFAYTNAFFVTRTTGRNGCTYYYPYLISNVNWTQIYYRWLIRNVSSFDIETHHCPILLQFNDERPYTTKENYYWMFFMSTISICKENTYINTSFSYANQIDRYWISLPINKVMIAKAYYFIAYWTNKNIRLSTVCAVYVFHIGLSSLNFV